MENFNQLLRSQNIYIGQEKINGIDCSVGYIKKFKWGWFATQLNTFVIIGQTEQYIDKTLIEEFSKKCYEYALKNHKGWPRGLQSAVGSIAILNGNSFDDKAIQFCENSLKKHWSAFEIPVLYDVTKKRTIKYKNTQGWGAIYFPFFNKTIEAITRAF